MKDLVFKSKNAKPVTNSLLVAQKFGKTHAHVLRAIDDLILKLSENQCKANFALTHQTTRTGIAWSISSLKFNSNERPD